MSDGGPGNFDSDTAMGLFEDRFNAMFDEIESCFQSPELLEHGEIGQYLVPCLVEILCCLTEGLADRNPAASPVKVPPLRIVERWRDDYLAKWDSETIRVRGKETFESSRFLLARRAVLHETFRRLIGIADAQQRAHEASMRRHEGPDGPTTDGKQKGGTRPREKTAKKVAAGKRPTTTARTKTKAKKAGTRNK
jgi:hypothetical protein